MFGRIITIVSVVILVTTAFLGIVIYQGRAYASNLQVTLYEKKQAWLLERETNPQMASTHHQPVSGGTTDDGDNKWLHILITKFRGYDPSN